MALEEGEYVDSEELGLLEYIIRIAPLGETEVEIPKSDDDYRWCGDYEMRRPDPCPKGIPRGSYGTG